MVKQNPVIFKLKLKLKLKLKAHTHLGLKDNERNQVPDIKESDVVIGFGVKHGSRQDVVVNNLL